MKILVAGGLSPEFEEANAEELFARDRMVFCVARTLGIPVVWNLAGGYQEPLSRVLEIHCNTMKACVEAYL